VETEALTSADVSNIALGCAEFRPNVIEGPEDIDPGKSRESHPD
jgi:hypothetical protein